MKKAKKSLWAVIGVIAAFMMLGVSASTAAINSTVFGSDNDGYGTFETSPLSTNAINEAWSLTADSVNYTFDTGTNDSGQVVASLLYDNSLDTSPGSSYTIEGVVTLTDGYGDDNNRIGMLLFNDTSSQTNDGGGIWMRLNTDQDTLDIVDGVAGSALNLGSTTASGAYSQDAWYGTSNTFTGDITYTNDVIKLKFTFKDQDGVEDEVYAQVDATNYPGTYFGFATKMRDRGTTNSNSDVPPIIDYNSFSVSVSTNPPDITAPSAPTDLTATPGDAKVNLSWTASPEPDVAYYVISRSETSGSGYSVVASNVTLVAYSDEGLVNDTTYYYVVKAVDYSENESGLSAEASATPVEAVLEGVVFGSNNDGYGDFTTSTPSTTNEIWTLEAESVQFRNQDGGTKNSSLLREFPVTREVGEKYTVKGVVNMTDGYADDNNRVGIYLFGDSAEVPSQNETGAIGIVFNTDDGSAGGPPGNDFRDSLRIFEGIDLNLITEVLRNQTIPYAQNLFGTEVTLEADFEFVEGLDTNSVLITNIVIVATITDIGGSASCTGTVLAADFTGDYFGFVTRSRARFYGDTNAPSPEARNLPWVMDYKSFLVAPDLQGYELWAVPYGGVATIGLGTNDYDLDGAFNIVEYVQDGDPTDDQDQGTPAEILASAGGLVYVHPVRANDDSLSYVVESNSSGLPFGSWTDAGFPATGTNVTGGDLDFVTNVVDTVTDELFIKYGIIE